MEHMLTDDNFDAKIKAEKKPFAVEFFATWCPHCQRMMPVVKEAAAELDGKAEFFLADVDKTPEKTSEYDVSGTPTFFFFKDGKKVGEAVGEMSKEALKQHLEKLL